MQTKQKLLLALTAYAVLALLAWQTLSNEAIALAGFKLELRTVTLIVLGVFAFRTLMHFWRLQVEDRREHRD